MVERKSVSDFSLADLRLHILRGTWIPNTGKHEKEDIESMQSTRFEKVCFSLVVKNEVEDTWTSQGGHVL